MTTILIIAIIIAVLILIGKLMKRKLDKSISYSSKVKKEVQLDDLEMRMTEKLIVNDYKGAVAIADKILLIEPNNYIALTSRASSLEALNFNLEAIDDYEKALNIDNSDANIYGLLGLTYGKIGDIVSEQENLKISMQKGLKTYEIYYNMLISAPDNYKEFLIKKAKVPENLQKRNPKDFIDNLSSVDKNILKEALKNQIHHLEYTISLNPNNIELKELYDFIKEPQD